MFLLDKITRPSAPTGSATPFKVISGAPSLLMSPLMVVSESQIPGSGLGVTPASRLSKLMLMVPPLRPGANVIVCGPGVLLAAIIASRRERVAGRLAIVLTPQKLSALNSGAALSVSVLTTMSCAAAREGKTPRHALATRTINRKARAPRLQD